MRAFFVRAGAVSAWAFLASVACAAGCSAAPEDEGAPEAASTTDESAYVVWQRSASCAITKARAPSIRVCVTGGGDLTRARKYTTDALRLWLDAVRPLDASVTSTVELTCTSPDAYLRVLNQGEYAYPGSVQVNSNSAFGTYLHEFGHAFACLGDTYVGGRAGACQAGQPHSVMCDGLLRNDLSADDVAGAQTQFRALVLGASGGGRPDAGASDAGGAGGGGTAGDADGDGVGDAQDRCTRTPAGSHVWRDQWGGRWRGCAPGEVPDR